jgi:hypothetical protein
VRGDTASRAPKARRLGPVRILTCVAATAVLTVVAAPASAFEEYSGTRSLGMGGSSRAWALGDTGPLLNPSGMALVKAYTLEGGYGYGSRLKDHYLHASIVDNTSAFNIAGGVYYTYHDGQRAPNVSAQGHEGGFALAIPFGGYVALGATIKYFRLSGDDAVANGVPGRDGGVTFDLGMTLRPMPMLAFALVGTNLRDLNNGQAPQGLGYGAAFVPVPNFVVSVDARTRFTPDNITNRKGTSVMAGVEWIIAQRAGARLGGGYDAVTGNSYMSAGASIVSEIGAVDAGIRQDVFQREIAPGVEVPRATFVGVSLRLFVPAMQTQPQ